MVRRTRLSTELLNEIRDIISREGFQPGQKFYSEHQLVDRLSASRPSIREALKMLEGNGEVHIEHGRGIFIGPERMPDLDSLGEYVRAHREPLRDHFEVRLLIEPDAARYAALRRDSDDLEQMRAAIAAFEDAARHADHRAAVLADVRLHEMISRATRNRTLFQLMRAMTTSLTEGWMSSLGMRGRIEASVTEHRAIVDAIGDGDGEAAAEAMRRHLAHAVDSIEKIAQGTEDSSCDSRDS
jgi:GntR family transcriptional regulator, transcriptional repressor for pyruvate dehydrogenase complex